MLMDNQKIKKIIEDLDHEIDTEDARTAIRFGGKFPGYALIANQKGLLRLAVELLKAAYYRDDDNGTPEKKVQIDNDWHYLSADPYSSINYIIRTDEETELESSSGSSTKLTIMQQVSALFGIIFGLFLFLLIIIGIIALVRWVNMP